MKHIQWFEQKINTLIGDHDNPAIYNQYYQRFSIILIVINFIAMVLESFKGIRNEYSLVFQGIELFSIFFFSIDYLMRIIAASVKYQFQKPIQSRIRFVFSMMGIIDLLSILPGLLELSGVALGIDARFLRLLRLTRLVRVLKLKRYISSMDMVLTVIKSKLDDLAVTLFIMFLILFSSSLLMYEIENQAQPDKFDNVLSALWWAIATLTTVGYGDIYPITPVGKLLSGFIAIIGIGIVALPTGIISSGFLDALSRKRKAAETSPLQICPHCGKKQSQEIEP